MANTVSEQAWAEIIARYNGMADQVDAGVARSDAQIVTARSEYGGLNVLRNALATEPDGAGGYHSPLTITTNYSGSETSATQRVLTIAEAQADGSVPTEIIAAADTTFSQPKFNIIEVTVSQNSGNGMFRLLSGGPHSGLVTTGAQRLQVAQEGIAMDVRNMATNQNPQRPLLPGVLYSDIRNVQNSAKGEHLNGLAAVVTGQSKKFWLVCPFVCAGRFAGNPLTLASPIYHFHDQTMGV